MQNICSADVCGTGSHDSDDSDVSESSIILYVNLV